MGNANLIKNYSEYLCFRSFYTGFSVEDNNLPEAENLDDAINFIKQALSNIDRTAILLSGGMDSAVILPFLPAGSTAYTIYHSRLESTEVEVAQSYCEKYGISHVPVLIDPDEYFSVLDELMLAKKMPLSSAEPIFYLAARQARSDGFEYVATGAGTDARFGGFPRFRKSLSSRRFQIKIKKKYHNPERILNNAVSLDYLFDRYLVPDPDGGRFKQSIFSLGGIGKKVGVIDSNRFLREIGFERFAFDNAISHAGCRHIAPFTQFLYNVDDTINSSRPKYFIRDLFERLYGFVAPEKLALQKPVFLLEDYRPSNLELFRKDIDFSTMDFQKKYLIYCLERFESLRLAGKL